MASLATPAELAVRLNTTFDADQTAQAQSLLDEASALIRSGSVTGQTISRVVDDTITSEAPNGRWLVLPQRPVESVSQVIVSGQVATDFTQLGDRLYRFVSWDNRYHVGSWWPWFPQLQPYTVTVTYTHGLAPDDDRIQLAKSACMVIACQAITNPNSVASEAIDDYRVVFRPDAGPLSMPENLAKSLNAEYGRAAFSIAPAVRL